MPVLDAHTMAANWIGNGGPKNRTVAWLAVSLAESSWNTDAVSPTDARGLYQLEPYSWPAGAGPLSGWDQPGPNSLAAIILSGGGMNFAPWDTAYANINASGRYSYLSWPENGSAASNGMPYVTALLGNNYGGSPAPASNPGVDGSLPAALDWYAQATASATPGLSVLARRVSSRASFMYRPGRLA